uniref:Uncharacterized protein n=1 Tax=Anguilla anguilla TaxID=7936 RepID=A0A0E9TC68_ANGAN
MVVQTTLYKNIKK